MTLHLDGAMWKQAESVVRTWKMVIAIFIQHKKCQNILAFLCGQKQLNLFSIREKLLIFE